jgi:hypothetical protein
MENIYKCPKCGEDKNLLYNYDYSQQHRPVKDVLCTKCEETFDGNILISELIKVSQYPELEGTMKLCEDVIQKRTGKMTEEEWQEAERAQTSGNTNEISDEEIMRGAKEWYNKDGCIRPSKIEIRAWICACKWYREQLKKPKNEIND